MNVKSEQAGGVSLSLSLGSWAALNASIFGLCFSVIRHTLLQAHPSPRGRKYDEHVAN